MPRCSSCALSRKPRRNNYRAPCRRSAMQSGRSKTWDAASMQERVQRIATELDQAEEAWVTQSAALLARRDQLEARGKETRAKREQSAARLDAGLLTRYDNIRRTRQGRAVSKVEQGLCQWCRVILTPSELQHVRASAELQTCSNCGRILYYER